MRIASPAAGKGRQEGVVVEVERGLGGVRLVRARGVDVCYLCAKQGRRSGEEAASVRDGGEMAR